MKLTEIEEVWDGIYATANDTEWTALYVPLLIRAVRQFGAYYKHSHPLLSEQAGIDPDVLELLDETVLDETD